MVSSNLFGLNANYNVAPMKNTLRRGVLDTTLCDKVCQ